MRQSIRKILDKNKRYRFNKLSPQWLYIVYSPYHNAVKIGKTKDLEGRLKQIISYCDDEDAYYLGYKYQPDGEEDMIHSLLTPYSNRFRGSFLGHGEWYSMTDKPVRELVQYLLGKCIRDI